MTMAEHDYKKTLYCRKVVQGLFFSPP